MNTAPWSRAFSFIARCLLFLLAATAAFSQQSGPECCLPPETDVAVYDFVPEAAIQAGDFRLLMKSQPAFLTALMEPGAVNVVDFTTPIPSAEMMPEAPQISGNLVPPPAESHTTYFIVGQITKPGPGFQLAVQLKKSPDGTLVHEFKTPFNAPGEAATAGTTSAEAVLKFLATDAQQARSSDRDNGHAIDPHITLVIDKLRLKPNEVSPVKVILTDCDGVRLKHRTIEAYLQLFHGSALVQADTLERVTDENGERNGDIGAKEPGIINYVVKYKYKDMMGNPRETSDTKTIIIANDGTAKDLWQMRADLLFERSTLYFRPDPQGGTFSGDRYYLKKKSSVVCVFKADSDASGEVATDEIKNFNGFGDVMFRRKSIDHSESAEVRNASGEMDHRQEAEENFHAAFSISPANNEFQASVGNVKFVGDLELFAVRRHPYNYVHRHEEYVDVQDGGGSGKITPEMIKSGVYSFTTTKRTPINDVKGNNALGKGTTKGFELVTCTVEVRRLNASGEGLIRK